jgi:hypothetical protein
MELEVVNGLTRVAPEQLRVSRLDLPGRRHVPDGDSAVALADGERRPVAFNCSIKRLLMELTKGRYPASLKNY